MRGYEYCGEHPHEDDDKEEVLDLGGVCICLDTEVDVVIDIDDDDDDKDDDGKDDD